MDTEFEAKFYPVDKDKFRQKLLSLGAKLITPERKMRRAIVDRHFQPQLKCGFVRVRDEGGIIRLSAKTVADKNGQISDQKETFVTVDDYDKTIEIIKLLGLNIDQYIETLRETWDFQGAEIEIDTWPGLDTYAEIEAKSEDQVHKISDLLSLDWDKKIVMSPVELFSEKYNLPIEEVLQKIAYITFESNPFAGLPTYPLPFSQSI